MNGIDLIAIAAVILIVALLAKLVQGDIRRHRAATAEVLREAEIRARADVLREVSGEADRFSDRKAQVAIRCAVHSIQQRERLRRASEMGAALNPSNDWK